MVFLDLTAVISPTHWGIYQFLRPNIPTLIENRTQVDAGPQWAVDAEAAGLSAGSFCIVRKYSPQSAYREVVVCQCSVFRGRGYKRQHWVRAHFLVVCCLEDIGVMQVDYLTLYA